MQFSPPLEDLYDVNAQKYDKEPQANTEMHNSLEFITITEEINMPITEAELYTAIKILKNRKLNVGKYIDNL